MTNNLYEIDPAHVGHDKFDQIIFTFSMDQKMPFKLGDVLFTGGKYYKVKDRYFSMPTKYSVEEVTPTHQTRDIQPVYFSPNGGPPDAYTYSGVSYIFNDGTIASDNLRPKTVFVGDNSGRRQWKEDKDD